MASEEKWVQKTPFMKDKYNLWEIYTTYFPKPSEKSWEIFKN